MLKTSSLLVAAALLGSTVLANAHENENGVSMYIPSYKADVYGGDAYARAPKAGKRSWSIEEKVLFENAKRLD